MALFGKKIKESENKIKTETKAVVDVKSYSGGVGANKAIATSVIINPRITEKTHTLAERSNVYVFNVKIGVTKGRVAEAIRDLYKISPIKVVVMPIPRKSRFVRGKAGFSGGGRKAYVYLKEGDKLEIN